MEHDDQFVPEEGQFENAEGDLWGKKQKYDEQRLIRMAAEGQHSGCLTFEVSDRSAGAVSRPVMSVSPRVRGGQSPDVVMDFKIRTRVPFSHKVGNSDDELPPMEDQFEDAEGPEYEKNLELDRQKEMKMASLSYDLQNCNISVRILLCCVYICR